MKKLLFLLILLLIPSTLAISIDDFKDNVFVGEEKNHIIEVTNNNDHDYYNLTFIAEDITIPKVSFMVKGTKKNVTAKIKTTKPYLKNISILATYIQKQAILPEPSEYQVNVNGSFSPKKLDVLDIDTITFTNVGFTPRTIRDISGEYKTTLNSSQSVSWQFTDNRTIYDIDTLETFGITIVPPEEQFIYDESDDYFFDAEINSTYKQTNVTFQPTQKKLTSKANDTIESVLFIQNANNKAYEVELSGEDMSFEKQKFTIDANDFIFLKYNITIDKKSKGETNKTYTYDISLFGANFKNQKQSIEVFVEFSDLKKNTTKLQDFCGLDIDDLDVGQQILYETYCLGILPKETETITETQLIEVDKYVDVQKSDIKKVNDIDSRVKAIETAINSRDALTKEQYDIILGQVQDMLINMNNVYDDLNSTLKQRVSELEKWQRDAQEEQQKKRMGVILFWSITGLIMMSAVVLLFLKKQRSFAEAGT